MWPSNCNEEFIEIEYDYIECLKCGWSGILNTFNQSIKTISESLNNIKFTENNLDDMDYCEYQLTYGIGI